jgi:hypothetical protein
MSRRPIPIERRPADRTQNMFAPQRTFYQLWELGIDELDRAAEQYEMGDAAAEESCRDARQYLEAAQEIAAEIGEIRQPVAEELERLGRLETKLTIETLDTGAPLSRLHAFDVELERGDAATKRDDREAAAIAYARAYELLEDVLEAADSDLPADPETCALCWRRPATTTVVFCGRQPAACGVCRKLVERRFPTVTAVRKRREALLTDIEDALGWTPGPEWLSAPTEGAGPGDPGAPETGAEGSAPETDPEAVFLVREFTAVSQQVGHPATPDDIDEHAAYSPADYRSVFGSWDDVVTQAGFEVETDEE